MAATYDLRALAPSQVTDPNGNLTLAAYDALGRVTALALQSKSVDSHGTALQAKVIAAPDVATPTTPRWVGTGRTVLNNKGLPVKRYEPFYSETSAFEPEDTVVEWGVSPTITYDPPGRATRVKLPNGTLRRVTFSPWEQAFYDENDTVDDADCTASTTLKDRAPAHGESSTGRSADRKHERVTSADTP